MYAEHVPPIALGCKADADIWARAIMFASLSIQQSIEQVPSMLDDLEETRSSSVYLWGFKRRTYEYVQLHKAQLHEILDLGLRDALDTLASSVPGLGLVKAGFCLQLAGYDVACLDTRNVRREGRDARAFRTDGRKPSRAKLDAYLKETEGKAERYWNAWCADVAHARGLEPEWVSGLHLSILPDNWIPF